MHSFQSKNDEDLCCLLKNGDELAFTEIYNRYWKKLYYVAHKLLKDTCAAEEIVQEVFLVVWKKRNTLNIQCLNQYLSAMTRYAVFSQLAREKKFIREEDSDQILSLVAAAEIDLDNKILLEMINTISQKLPEKTRLIFQYNKIQDRSMQDISAELDMPKKTIEAHLTKSMKIIKASVKEVTKFGYLLFLFLLFKS